MTNNRKINVKKSQFSASTNIPGDATLDYVSQSTNLKITFADFVTNLGVTGTIGQVGSVSGTPVLDTQGAFNGIRNLEPGPGISTSISPENGLTISSSFTFDTAGVALVDNPASPNPMFRSLLEGPGIDIEAATGTITFTADTSELKPANRVLINAPEDFPAPVAGLITLEANTEYYIGDNITILGSFASIPNNVVFRGQREISSLTYEGANTLFPGNDVGSFTLSGLTIDTPNAEVFDLTDSSPVSKILIANCSFANAAALGSLTGVSSLSVSTVSASDINNGFSLSGSINRLFIENAQMTSLSNSFKSIDLGSATFDNIFMGQLSVDAPSGAFGISGLADNGNINSGQIAGVSLCSFSGGMTPLENITENDVRWRFEANTFIQDTSRVSFLSMVGNATETVISSSGVPVKVAGSTFVEEVGSQFQGSTDGRIEYIGEREARVSIDIILAAELASGTNDATVLLATGNTISAPSATVIAASAQQQELASGDPRTMVTSWELSIQENDFFEIWIQNDAATNNIIVSSVKFRVKA